MTRGSFRVRGRVSSSTGMPAEGVIVQAFDKDLLRDQSLGTALTDSEGRYDIQFDRSAFTGPLITLEQSPDVFLHVFDRKGNQIASTEKAIVVNAGRETNIDVAVQAPLPAPMRFRTVAGEAVDMAIVSKLTARDLVDAYRYVRGRNDQFAKADLLREAIPGLFFRRKYDDCGEGRLNVLRRLARERGAFDLDSDTDADDLPAGATIHWFYTANVAVKYTTDAAFPNDAVDPAVPAADAAVQLSDGTTMGFVRAALADLHPDNTELAPTYVQQVGVIAEYALAQYLGPRFNVRDPRNGAARMEYRIRQQPPNTFGQTNPSWSHVEVKPSNTLLQNIHTVSHEMFHQVQYRYNNVFDLTGFRSSIFEGGARLVEDCINDVPNRWALTAKDLLDDPTQALMDYPAGTKSSVRYASGILWKYLAERHSTATTAADEPAIGFDAYRKVLEAIANVQPGDPGIGFTPAALRNARGQMPWYGSFDEFGWYSVAQNELSSNETSYGNFLVANYLHGTANPVGDARFDYKEDEDPITWTAAPDDNLGDFQAAVAVGNDIALTQGLNTTRNVNQSPYAATYFRLTPAAAPAPRMLRVTFTAAAGLTDPLVQILRLGAGSTLVDLHRSDRAMWTKTINVSGLTSIAVIVGTRMSAGDYSIQFEEIASASDVMVTRWNSQAGTEYESDPQGWSWTWVSPDVMVDTNDDLIRDTDVFFGQNNKLKLRLRNRGNAPANGVTVQFFYQRANPGLNPASWMPVTNAMSAVQTAGPINLAAGAEQWVSVDWAPVDDGTHAPHWCVKAVITAPGDPNSDNKVVLSNFGHVIESDGDSLLQMIQVATDAVVNKIHVIPRGPQFMLVPKKWSGDPLQSKGVRDLCACGPRDERLTSRIAFGSFALETRSLQAWDGTRELQPHANRFYPVDPRTLPPGAVAENLVTIAHLEDGRVAGGVTYEVVPK